MKRTIFLLLLVSMVLWSACLVKSFKPFYFDQDVITDNRLSGNFMENDSSLWVFELILPDTSKQGTTIPHAYYSLSHTDEEGDLSKFFVTLFQLDDRMYLDFLPDQESSGSTDLYTMHLLPVHTLARIDFGDDDQVSVKWMKEDWLNELIKSGNTDIDYQLIHYEDDDEGSYILSASTAELQAFIKTYADDPNAFDCEDDGYCIELKRMK